MTVIAHLKPADHDAEVTSVRHQLASHPAYRIGWMEGKLAHHKVTQSQQHVLSEEMAAMKKLYRDVFRLAADVRLQSESRQSDPSWQDVVKQLQKQDGATQVDVQDLKGQVKTLLDQLQQNERDVLPWVAMTSRVHDLLKQGQDVHGQLAQRMNELEVQHALQHDHLVREHMEHATRLDERVHSMFEQVLQRVQTQSQEHAERQQRLLALCHKVSSVVDEGRLQHDAGVQMLAALQKAQESHHLALDQVQSLLATYASEHQDRVLMQQQLVELQERTELALQEFGETKQILASTISLKDKLEKDVQSALQHSQHREAMLSQLCVDAHQRSVQMEKHLQTSQKMHERQAQDLASMSALRQQVEGAHAEQHHLQARSLLNLARAEELIAQAATLEDGVQRAAQQIEETAHQQQGCYQAMQALYQHMQHARQELDDRLSHFEQISLLVDEGRDSLERAILAEKQARRELQEQEVVHERLHHENAELMCQLQACNQREEAWQLQWQSSLAMAAQLQKQIEEQAIELNRSRTREAQWMQALQDHEQWKSSHQEELAQKDRQAKHWHKLAVEALRRLKEAELAQREAGVNQKEHQWLMTQTRQEQAQLHRERQAMQTQLQDLEARLQELWMGQQEERPAAEAWKPALEQLHNQMLECRLEMARLRSAPVLAPVTPGAVHPSAVAVTAAAPVGGTRRWWR